MQIYLALGTNLGDRLANLESARRELSAGVVINQCSGIYETPPWGYTQQPAFLNQVISGETELAAHDLLHFVKEIEQKMGRVSTFRNGPRLIDIDILLYGGQQVNLPDLIIPHPRMLERGFVLVPLAEIAPDLILPGTNLSVEEHLQNIDRSGIHLMKALV